MMTAAKDYRNFSEVPVGRKFHIADGVPGIVYVKCGSTTARTLHTGKVYQLRPGKLCVVHGGN